MENEWKSETKNRGERNSGVRTSETASQSPTCRRRAEGAPPTLPVPTACNPQSITSLSLCKFQNLEIFLVQTLNPSPLFIQESKLWLMAGYGTLQHAPAAAGCQYPVLCIFFPCPKVRLPLPLLFPSSLSYFFLSSLILNLIALPNFSIFNLFFPFFWVMR